MSYKIKEFLYCNNKLRRTSDSVFSAEAEETVELVKQNFPEEIKYIFNSKRNHIGISDGYRNPYCDGQISLYCFTELPNDLITKYQVDTSNMKLLPYFGLKFNMMTKEVMLKVIFEDQKNYVKIPNIPNVKREYIFFGLIYRQDGTIHNEVDSYMFRVSKDIPNYNSIKEYCINNNVEIPIDDVNILDNCKLWCVVFDYNDSSIVKMVKAYNFVKIYD